MIEYDQEPKQKKKKKKKKKRKPQPTNTWLIVGIVAGVLLLIGGVVLVVVINMPRQGNDVQAKGNAGPEQKPPGQQPGPQGVAPLPKLNPQAKGVVQSVRNAAYRPERLNDLREIARFFNLYVNDIGRNPKTEDEFVQYLQRDAPKIAEALREKYYVVNLKAKVASSQSVVAYEKLTEANCHQTARGDCSVSLVTPEDLAKLLME